MGNGRWAMADPLGVGDRSDGDVDKMEEVEDARSLRAARDSTSASFLAGAWFGGPGAVLLPWRWPWRWRCLPSATCSEPLNCRTAWANRVSTTTTSIDGGQPCYKRKHSLQQCAAISSLYSPAVDSAAP
jgi:hypothetical protein